jgi:hypothetical protein
VVGFTERCVAAAGHVPDECGAVTDVSRLREILSPGETTGYRRGMSGRRYELRVMYTIEVTDPDLVMEAAYQRYLKKLTAVHEPTPWHRDQWQRWVDDGSSDGLGVDVALHEFVESDGRMAEIPGASATRAGTWAQVDQVETVSDLSPPERAEFMRRYGHVYGAGGPFTQLRFRLINWRNRRRRHRQL